MFYGKDIKKNHIYNSLYLFLPLLTNGYRLDITCMYLSLSLLPPHYTKKNKRIFIRLFRQEFLESSSDSLRNRYRQM